ncbi:MAG: AAA family ATPase [Phenylobacterium sp.]|nr:AAA family ATPase [Phenylobacterium sp.]
MLVGPSCAGKSTLADAVQTLSTVPYLIQSLDGLFAATPDSYGGSGEHTLEGFRYDCSASEHSGGAPIRRIAYGPVGQQLLEGFHRAVAAYAHAGVNVVVDDMLLNLDVLRDWSVALEDVSTLLVSVSAPKEELLRRENARTRRSTPGLVEGHFDLHRGIVTDVEIDTAALAPSDGAQCVLDAVTATSPLGAALQSLRQGNVA